VFEQKGEGWEEKRLGDTCIVERGSSPRPIEKYQTDSPDGVNWIKIGDTKGVDKYIYFTKEKITREGAEKSRYVKEGDFILSNSMSFGKPYIMKTDGYIHDGWFVLRLPNYLDKDYFYYLLTSPNVQKQIQSLGAGAIVKNISGDLVKKVDVFFPKSKEQQQSIVHQLDALRVKIQQLEAAYRQKITDLEEMKKSILQKAFNGELKTS
jgi:type I restriction enzyme S subunit